MFGVGWRVGGWGDLGEGEEKEEVKVEGEEVEEEKGDDREQVEGEELEEW